MLKRTLLILCILIPFALHAAEPEAGPDAAKAEKEVLRADSERFQAMVRKDLDALGSMLSDDLTYGTSDGRLLSKGDFLSALKSRKLEYRSIEPKNVAARVQGATAVVHGRAEMAVGPEASGLKVAVRYLAVYFFKDGRWVMSAWQSAEIQAK